METSHGTTASIRTRWAAIGAAIAVTLGAGGGFGLASATLGSGERAVFVAIEPCRLVDTRPAPDTIGPRNTPLGAGDTYNVQARGAQGNCNLPTTATGVVLNVTAVGATAQTNLRFFPTGGTAPTVSNLNPAPGAPPAPNAVTTRLANDGRFSIFNFRGNVNVIVDVAGYYTDHHHDDRYFTKEQVGAANIIEQATGGGSVTTSQTVQLSRTFSLPDRCPGPDLWKVRVSAVGYFLTGANPNTSATVGLSVNNAAGYLVASANNQTLAGTGQVREQFVTDYVFELDAGDHTAYLLAVAGSASPSVVTNLGKLIVQSVSVECST
jgi:hypothetical protein